MMTWPKVSISSKGSKSGALQKRIGKFYVYKHIIFMNTFELPICRNKSHPSITMLASEMQAEPM